MPTAQITATTSRPEPPNADFAFYLDYKKGEGPASRVFSATHAFIRACESIDLALARSIDVNIEPVVVLEDIAASSLKTFLKTELRSIDDQALKNLNWKPLVGKYLVRAKYFILRWADGDEDRRDVRELSDELQKLASDTDVRHIPAYAPVSSRALLRAIMDFDRVKDHLVSGDQAYMVVSDEEMAHFNLSSRLEITDLEDLATKERKVHHISSMVMVVKKPDYLGSSMWECKYGTKTVPVRIEDEAWLKRFQARQVDVRPGDALRCKGRIEESYGHDDELVVERHFIEEVIDVLEHKREQNLRFLP